jgi:hypothetical protein
VVETKKGAVVGSFRANVSIELWRFDADVPPLVGPCDDTDGQSAPWATGTAHIAANDNDLDVSLTRTKSFGDKGQASVEDADGGDWHYSWTFHARISKDDVFDVSVEDYNLSRRGALAPRRSSPDVSGLCRDTRLVGRDLRNVKEQACPVATEPARHQFGVPQRGRLLQRLAAEGA